MPPIPADRFWALLGESRLVPAAEAEALRREFEGLPFPPGAAPAGVGDLASRWLAKRGVITEWQAKRLRRGEGGPFFLGDYRLLDRFETGRGGVVFRARHEASGRPVGLVALNNKFCQVPEVWSDLLRRTKAATESTDPTLSRTWALERAGAQRFVVADDVVGVPLADELARRGALEVREAGEIVLAVARAVAELHRRGVVHGAISLDSVRREAPEAGGAGAGRIRLLQFPLVADPHVVPPRIELDGDEAVARLGTRASFLPPEWLKAGRVLDTTGDVYALGCLFHALLTGQPPAWQGDPQRTLAAVAGGRGPDPLEPGTVPLEVATLVSYLVARAPADRYPTAAEAADAIAACLGRPPVSPGLPEQEPMIVAGSGPGTDVAEPDVVAAVTLVDHAPAPATARPRPSPAARKGVPKAALAGLGLLATAAIVAVLALRPAGPAAPRPAGGDARNDADAGTDAEPAQPGATAAPAEPAETAGAVPPAAAVTTLVGADEARNVPFEAPQPAGPPPRLAYLPPGSQLVLLVRPSAALATPEGERFARALGPRAAAALDAAARMAGVAPEAIEEIQAGWQAGGPDEVVGGVLVRGTAPLPPAADAAARERALGPTTEQDLDGETLYRGAGLTAWFPSDAEERVVVVGPDDLVQQAVSAHRASAGVEGVEAALPRDLEDLVALLDATRHVTLFGSPDYLLHDGRPVLAGPLARLVDPLARFFGDEVKAAALSIHFGPDAYLEIDAIPPPGIPAAQLARRLADNVAGLADVVEEYCNALDPHPYGRKLVMRLPRMLSVVSDQVHAGSEGRGAIVNAWLPASAPHNLALAVELALEQVPRAGGAGAGVAAAAPAARATVADRLARPMSLVFVKDTLEKSIQMIAEEIGVEIEILGKDLELEGITKNQSFALEERDRPAVEILRTILAKANPDGKLVWLVRSGPDGERVEISTRAAAARRGDTIGPGQDEPAPAEGEAPAEGSTDR